jgi:hypothetical protein
VGDGSAGYGPEGGAIDPSHFGFLGEGMAKDWPVEGRVVRKRELFVGDNRGEGEGDEGRLSFFLKNLPSIFFGPFVGVVLLSVSVNVGAGGGTGSTPPDESERADDAGVCTPSGPPGRGAAFKTKSLWCSSILVRLLDGGNRDADAG